MTATVESLVREVAAIGVELAVTGHGLSYRAPKGALTPELKERLRQHKMSIAAYLNAAIDIERTGSPTGVVYWRVEGMGHSVEIPISDATTVALLKGRHETYDKWRVNFLEQGHPEHLAEHAALSAARIDWRDSHEFKGPGFDQRSSVCAACSFEISPGVDAAEHSSISNAWLHHKCYFRFLDMLSNEATAALLNDIEFATCPGV